MNAPSKMSDYGSGSTTSKKTPAYPSFKGSYDAPKATSSSYKDSGYDRYMIPYPNKHYFDGSKYNYDYDMKTLDCLVGWIKEDFDPYHAPQYGSLSYNKPEYPETSSYTEPGYPSSSSYSKPRYPDSYSYSKPSYSSSNIYSKPNYPSINTYSAPSKYGSTPSYSGY